MLRSLVATLDAVVQYWHMLCRVWNRSNFSSNICYHFFRSRNRWSVPHHSFAWFVQHCSACACALTPVQTKLVPRAIRGLGLTNDPGTGCKMCKILAHFPSWYHGKVAHGYPIWRFAAFSILCAVSTMYAFFRSRLSGDLCSWCPSVVMDRNSWKFVRPFRSFGKLFSGSLSFTHKTIPGDHFNEFCLLFFPSYLLKTFRCPSSPLAAQASDSDSAVLSPDSIYLALITHSQSWQNVHTSHCGRIVCVSWSDDHFAPVQVGFLGMYRKQHDGTDQSQTMFYLTDGC